MSFAQSLVEKNKLAYFNASPGSDNKAIIKECAKDIKKINLLLKSAKTIGEKQHLTACVGQLIRFHAVMKKTRVTYGGGGEIEQNKIKWEDSQSAFKGRIRTGFVINLGHKDPSSFLDDVACVAISKLKSSLKKYESIKVNTVFAAEFAILKNDTEVLESKFFSTPNVSIFRDTDLNIWFTKNVKQAILGKIEEFQEKESGWMLKSILSLQLNINKFTAQVGSSYVELPAPIARKEACINVRNKDNACFAWAVLSGLYPVNKHPQRVSKYPPPQKVLNLTGIQFPMTLRQVPRFEKQNGISINVYILKLKKRKFVTLPVYLTKAEQTNHINLLMIQDKYENEEDEDEASHYEELKYHFVYIKNLSRLVGTQLNYHNGRKHFCNRCLHYFQTQTGLDKHREDCVNMNHCKVRLPSGDQAILKFKDHSKKIKSPFIIYADLECLLESVDSKNLYQSHTPCSLGYYVKCSYDESLSFYKSYRGGNPIKWFTQEINQFAEDLETVFLCPLPMTPLTCDEQFGYDNAVICHICEKPFSPDDKKVLDHDHLTGRYRGPAHECCNINYHDSHVVPIVFHNLSGYDAHFIIKSIAGDLPGRIDLLPVNMEKYISFTKHITNNLIKFRFIDSFRFLGASLDKLASYLSEYPILTIAFPNLNIECLNLLKRKGVFPYDYFTSIEKFNEEKLPDKAKFYNKLNDESISDEDYEHAQKIWQKFNIKNLGEYSDLYLKTDVILLADVFEQFRKFGLVTYGLDPAHFFTLPGYTWSCMLKYTSIELELLTDIDMIMFVERGIRGGLSQCMKRYAKANNKYCENYNPAEPSKYLIYNDINNQYGWAMSESLGYGGFQWLSDEEIGNFNVENIADGSPEGYILEVDLEYPQDLHDLHSDLPFCPEHLSAPGSKEKKLMATLYDKTKYVMHYRTLKQALKHGLKLITIRRGLKFKQSTWLKPYIDLNTKLRKKAENDFEKNLFKLMNNAVFGKTMENIRKHSNVKLVTKWEGRYGAGALIASPRFKSVTIFEEDLVAIELNKSEIYFNKPIYVGLSILDIAKIKFYEFHYEYMKNRFGDKCTALYTDTDSVIYEIFCDDLYDIIREDCYLYFDTSDYAPSNRFGIPLVNKKVLGLMKDEMNGKIMTEFVGLRSKMYAIRVEGEDTVKKIKGIKRNIVKNRITFDDYLECLKTQQDLLINQNLIKSEKHRVSSVTQVKAALRSNDDKRFLIANDVTTLPYGHYNITDVKMDEEI